MALHFAGLDPAILDRLSSLSLVARKVVEGTLAGTHRSPHRGSSVEFAQHRAYAPGDEVRRIDWKVFARSERLVVKEYVEETNLACNLLLDASESMAFHSLDWSKFDYARWAVAALSHLVIGARDTAGLVVFDEGHRSKVPPGNGTAQEVAILKTLEDSAPGGPTAIGEVLHALAPRLRRRGITMIFSDFFDEVPTILEGVRRLVHQGHEPILVQVLDPLEKSFELDALLKLEGLEGAGSVKIDPKAIREAYLEELEVHNRELARGARALSIDLIQTTTDKPLDAVLSTYLTRRSARARGGGR
jgi:uncharacterized protein (DUF58 family)